MTVNVLNKLAETVNMTFFQSDWFGIMIDKENCLQIRGKTLKENILLWERLLE